MRRTLVGRKQNMLAYSECEVEVSPKLALRSKAEQFG